MITAAENTTPALITQCACVTISHTSEFFWYALNFCVPEKLVLGFRRTAAHLKKVLVTVMAMVVLTQALPADGAQSTIIKMNCQAKLGTIYA